MVLDLRKQSVRRDLGKALCEDMLKDFRTKFIILKQERPKIKKTTKYLVNDKIYEGLNSGISVPHVAAFLGATSRYWLMC